MSLFDLSGVVELLSDVTVTVVIPQADTYDSNGNATVRTYGTPVTGVKASAQPVRGADLAKLPAGELVTEWFTVYANTPMPVGAKVTVSDGRVGEVRVGNDWRGNGNFSKAMVKLFDKDEPRTTAPSTNAYESSFPVEFP